MSIYRPRKPSNGKGAPSQFLMFCISVWEMLFNGKFPFQDTNTIKWKCGAAGYSAQWVNPGSSSGGNGGGVGGGGGWNYRGAFVAGTYNTNDVVQLGTGTSAGMYLSLINGNTNAPDSGIGWVQISTSSGTWL